MEYLKMLFDFSGYEDHPERWGEPSNGAVAAVCLATFLFVSAAFVLEALYMAIF